MAVDFNIDLAVSKIMYETTFLVVPTIGESEYKDVVSKFEKIITETDGDIINLEHWGQKKLAYEIQKHHSAYYCYVEYNAPAAVIEKLEREFRYDENVIRSLNVRVERHHAAFNKKRREQGFGKKEAKGE